MSWWSAQNFCQVHEKRMAGIVDLECAPIENVPGYCYKTESSTGESNVEKSTVVEKLYMILNTSTYFWLQDLGSDNCNGYYVTLNDGLLGLDGRNDWGALDGSGYVLCK